ncbi:MAG TPA: TonB family protein [Ignavibacteriaceae bacterium]|nr:TonB family protein [Ignavibacteriaceae bacterium]
MKFKLIISIVFLFSSISFSQATIKKEFYPNGNLESEISYEDSIRDGEAKFYFENGNSQKELTYVNGRVEGTVKLYYENGKVKEIYTITGGKREGVTLLYDSTGNFLSNLVFTDGKLNISDDETTPVEKESKTDSIYAARIEELKHSTTKAPLPPKLSEEHLKDDPAFFINIDEKARPYGGMGVIYKKLIYPKKARKNDIEGIVDVLTFVDEKGNVVETKIQKGIGHGCDEEAEKAIKYSKFHPGILKGEPVKSQVVISVEFKSNNN